MGKAIVIGMIGIDQINLGTDIIGDHHFLKKAVEQKAHAIYRLSVIEFFGPLKLR